MAHRTPIVRIPEKGLDMLSKEEEFEIYRERGFKDAWIKDQPNNKIKIPDSRPTEDQVIMEVARVISTRSTCSRLQVGAVISRDGRFLSSGFNGAPTKMAHCVHTDPSVPCEIAVHAELNAICFAGKYGIALEGADLFTTYSPCKFCAKAIINTGIKRVVIGNEYRDMTGQKLCREAGLKVEFLTGS